MVLPASSSFEVRPSLLPHGAGQGLFTACAFAAGEVLLEYTGHVLSTREALRLRDKSYLMRLGAQVYVDASVSDCLARYINDCGHPQGHNVMCRKQPEAGKAVILAARDLAAGEELFLSYGPWYWLAVRLSSSSSMRRASDAELEAMWQQMGMMEKRVVR